VKHPELLAWLSDEKAHSSRLPGNAQRRSEVLHAALDVTETLPATGIGRARLSWQVFRDTKALSSTTGDQYRRACVLRAVAALAGRGVPADLAAERELWEAVGVSVDPLSSRVLLAGFTPGGQSAVPHSLRLKTSASLASVLTLADVDGWLASGFSELPARVFVCENPEVTVTALSEFGSSCPALICTEGRPHLAAVRLISALIDAGVPVSVHADFDWDGLSIVGAIMQQGGEAWRMSAQDYAAAVTAAAANHRTLPKLTGSVVPTPWSPELQHALRRLNVEVHEEDEGVLTALLCDMSDNRHARAAMRSLDGDG
jgi:uncharacterized protein (TIGR02679 family)